jgi:hypothetical protein
MHGTFSHRGRPRPTHNIKGEDAMFYALQELYAGQPVRFGGKPTFIQFTSRGMVWLAGFESPVPLSKVEAT